MAERNLQALDLRHTLPNLKNLLLTLTSGATIVLKFVSLLSFKLAFLQT
jgi:UV radiation resistance-associated gene protein